MKWKGGRGAAAGVGATTLTHLRGDMKTHARGSEGGGGRQRGR